MSVKRAFGQAQARTYHNPYASTDPRMLIRQQTFRSRYTREAQVLPALCEKKESPRNKLYYCPSGISIRELPTGRFQQFPDATPIGRYMQFRRENLTRKRYIEGGVVYAETELRCLGVGVQ